VFAAGQLAQGRLQRRQAAEDRGNGAVAAAAAANAAGGSARVHVLAGVSKLAPAGLREELTQLLAGLPGRAHVLEGAHRSVPAAARGEELAGVGGSGEQHLRRSSHGLNRGHRWASRRPARARVDVLAAIAPLAKTSLREELAGLATAHERIHHATFATSHHLPRRWAAFATCQSVHVLAAVTELAPAGLREEFACLAHALLM